MIKGRKGDMREEQENKGEYKWRHKCGERGDERNEKAKKKDKKNKKNMKKEKQR